MRFEWQPSDLEVRVVAIPEHRDMWIVGHTHWGSIAQDKLWCLISMGTGEVEVSETERAFLDKLNEGYVPLEFLEYHEDHAGVARPAVKHALKFGKFRPADEGEVE